MHSGHAHSPCSPSAFLLSTPPFFPTNLFLTSMPLHFVLWPTEFNHGCLQPHRLADVCRSLEREQILPGAWGFKFPQVHSGTRLLRAFLPQQPAEHLMALWKLESREKASSTAAVPFLCTLHLQYLMSSGMGQDPQVLAGHLEDWQEVLFKFWLAEQESTWG